MPVKVGVIFLTPACQLKCAFCGSDQGFDPMDGDKAAGLLASLKAAGADSVVLGGGEPFLWGGGVARLAQEARRLGLVVQVGSNGLLAPDSVEGLRAFDRWVLPLESMREGVHGAMRPAAVSHWQVVLGLLERLREAQVEVTVSSVATAENADGLEAVGAHLRDYQRRGGRVHAWHIYQFLPVGRGGARNAPRFALEPSQFMDLGQRLKGLFGDLTLFLRPDMYHSRQVSFHWQDAGALHSLDAEGHRRPLELGPSL